MNGRKITIATLCGTGALLAAALIFNQKDIAPPEFGEKPLATAMFAGSSQADNGNDPTELLFFDAIWNGLEVILTWEVENEIEVVGYQIERAGDDLEFERIGWIYSKDISREVFYEYVDENITPNETYFYRLKLVKYDGSTTYFGVTKALKLLQ